MDVDGVPQGPDAPHEGLGAGTWLHLTLRNMSEQDLKRTLVMHNPTLPGAGPLGAGVAGLRVRTALSWRDTDDTLTTLAPANGRNTVIAYDLVLPEASTVQIALLVDGASSSYSLSAWDPAAFQRQQRTIAAGKGLLFGALLVLAVLVAGRWVLEGQEEDLAAAAFVGTAILFIATALGSHYGLIAAYAPLSGTMRATALVFFAVGGLYFVRQRLPLERLHPSLPGHLSWMIVLGSLLAIAALPAIGFEKAAGPFAAFAVSVSAGLVFLMARRGEYRAPAMLPGAIFLLLCTLAATVLSFLAPTPYAGLQTLMLTGAIAAGTGLASLAAAISRQPVTGLHELDYNHDRLTSPALGLAQHRPGGDPAAVLAASNDPTAERSLLALDAADEGVWDFDVLTEHLFVSPKVEAWLGLAAGTLNGVHDAWLARLHREDVDMYRNAIASYTARGSSAFELEFRLRHSDGTYRWLGLKAASLGGDAGRASRMVGVLSDVSARRNQQAHDMIDAVHDTLTGVANRVLLLDRIEQVLNDAPVSGDASPALMIIDLDRFKLVNESLGHGDGDSLLITIARRLEGLVNPDDTVARIGGDEFAVFLRHGIGEEGAENAGRIVSDILCAPLQFDDEDVIPSVSLGLVEAAASSGGAQGLLRDAELALYKAKARGQGQIGVFEPAMRKASQDRLSLETGLKRALERDEIEVQYQPIMSLKDGQLSGFEALMRWAHPKFNTMSPEDVMETAEEIGAIHEIGYHVITKAATQLGRWQHAHRLKPPLFVSVNVAPSQLVRPGFADDVARALNAAKVGDASLRLEVTESTVMADPEMTLQVLRDLKERGAELCLDDFGTGYSSLSHLQRYPFQMLKIDRSFIIGMRNNTQTETIVRSIVTLAHELGKKVVAEGPESEQDVRKLRAMGCDYAQGFVFGAPMPVEAAQELLKRAGA